MESDTGIHLPQQEGINKLEWGREESCSLVMQEEAVSNLRLEH